MATGLVMQCVRANFNFKTLLLQCNWFRTKLLTKCLTTICGVTMDSTVTAIVFYSRNNYEHENSKLATE